MPGRARWPLGAAIVTVALWATSFPTLRFALNAYTPGEAAFLRCAFAALTMAAYALFTRMPLPSRRDWAVLSLFGISGIGVSSLGLTFGLRTVSAGAGAFVVGMIPVFSALLALRFLGERLKPMAWAGIALSMTGVIVIGLGEGDRLRINMGVGLVAGSAFAQAIFYVFQKPYLLRYSPVQVTAWAAWSGALALTPWLPGGASRLMEVPWPYTAALAWQGVFSIAFAFMLWSSALGHAPAAIVTSTVYLMPLLSLGIAWAWLGEIPAPASLAGGLLALAGVALLNLRRS